MRIQDKISEINHYLSELESFIPNSFNEYETDIKLKAACERYYEKITQAILDLIMLILKEKGYRIPEESKEALEILCQEKIITKELADKLKQAKGMRNVLAHQYGNIDDNLVFESITKELIKDTKRFIKSIKKKI